MAISNFSACVIDCIVLNNEVRVSRRSRPRVTVNSICFYVVNDTAINGHPVSGACGPQVDAIALNRAVPDVVNFAVFDIDVAHISDLDSTPNNIVKFAVDDQGIVITRIQFQTSRKVLIFNNGIPLTRGIFLRQHAQLQVEKE